MCVTCCIQFCIGLLWGVAEGETGGGAAGRLREERTCSAWLVVSIVQLTACPN